MKTRVRYIDPPGAAPAQGLYSHLVKEDFLLEVEAVARAADNA
jgi:hypothetical protein